MATASNRPCIGRSERTQGKKKRKSQKEKEKEKIQKLEC
jgi:hypothetical protein